MPAIPFSEEDIQRMVDLYVNYGMTFTEIGKEFHCHRTTVAHRLHGVGIETIRRGIPVIPERELKQVAFLYERVHMSQVEIADLMGFRSRSTISRRLRKMKVLRRPPTVSYKIRQEQRDMALAELKRGMNVNGNRHKSTTGGSK